MLNRLYALLGVVVLLLSSCAAEPEIIAMVRVDPAELGRQASIDSFSAASFLPEQISECVVGEVHDATGIWNPSAEQVLAELDLPEIIAECSAPEEDEPRQVVVTRTSDNDDDDEDDGDDGSDSDDEEEAEVAAEPFELTPETTPTLVPGSTSTSTINIDGTDVEFVITTPAGFQLGSTAPVFLAFPPGGQDLRITNAVAVGMYEWEALNRGWVVINPAAPRGRNFFSGSEALVPEMLQWIDAWVTPEGGRPHLGGMSNGGISAFRIAAQNPDAFQSLSVFPGYPQSRSDKAALADLASIPVHMWVGGSDTGWVSRMEEAASEIRTYGGAVELNVLPGEPHVLQSTQDGVALFNALDAAR